LRASLFITLFTGLLDPASSNEERADGADPFSGTCCETSFFSFPSSPLHSRFFPFPSHEISYFPFLKNTKNPGKKITP
jgi:hypothetical protein